jgi:multiple sugar transport system substrate-binding protein
VAYEDFRRKLTSAIAGGVAPDVIRSDIAWVPEYADMGALVPLDEEMGDFAQIKGSFYPGPLSTNLWNGHYYGLPLDTNTKVWLYKAELYAEGGSTSAPTSLDALEGICAKLKKAEPDKYLFGSDGTFGWVTLPWVWSFGGEITDAAVTTATGYINGPKTVAAYEYLLRLYDQGCIAPVILGDGVDPFLGFGQGLYASLDNGPWTYPILDGQNPDFKFSSGLFPAGAAGSIDVVGGEDVNVLTQTAHKAEALEFVRFLVGSDFQLGMGDVGQIPARSDVDLSTLLAAHPELSIFFDQLKTSRARPAHPQWSNMDQILTDAGQLILRHELSPQAALDGAATKIDALLGK